jgi:hypothetical protein
MKTKQTYLAANIRAGYTVTEAAALVSQTSQKDTRYYVSVTSFDHGRDVYGNGTAHYRCTLIERQESGRERVPCHIVESGKRREQVGYGSGNDAALYALAKLGYKIDESRLGSNDYRGTAEYPLIDFPPAVSPTKPTVKIIGKWTVEHPTTCNGAITKGMAFLSENYSSDFVHFYDNGEIAIGVGVKCANKKVIEYLKKLSTDVAMGRK